MGWRWGRGVSQNCAKLILCWHHDCAAISQAELSSLKQDSAEKQAQIVAIEKECGLTPWVKFQAKVPSPASRKRIRGSTAGEIQRGAARRPARVPTPAANPRTPTARCTCPPACRSSRCRNRLPRLLRAPQNQRDLLSSKVRRGRYCVKRSCSMRETHTLASLRTCVRLSCCLLLPTRPVIRQGPVVGGCVPIV